MEYSRKLEYLKREEELIKEEELEAEALLHPSSPTLQVCCCCSNTQRQTDRGFASPASQQDRTDVLKSKFWRL